MIQQTILISIHSIQNIFDIYLGLLMFDGIHMTPQVELWFLDINEEPIYRE